MTTVTPFQPPSLCQAALLRRRNEFYSQSALGVLKRLRKSSPARLNGRDYRTQRAGVWRYPAPAFFLVSYRPAEGFINIFTKMRLGPRQNLQTVDMPKCDFL